MNIVTLNIGSGSQKVLLFSSKQGRRDANLAKEPVWEAKVDTTAPNQPPGKLFVFVKVNGAPRRLELGRSSPIEERLHFAFDLMTQADTQALNELSEVDAVAHRVVHGGSKYSEAVEIDERVEKEIDRLGSLSPLHNPAQLLGVKAAKKEVRTNCSTNCHIRYRFPSVPSPRSKDLCRSVQLDRKRNHSIRISWFQFSICG
jgi:acetate kinase